MSQPPWKMLESEHRLHVASCSEGSSCNAATDPPQDRQGSTGPEKLYKVRHFHGPNEMKPEANRRRCCVAFLAFHMVLPPTICGILSGTPDDPGVPDPIVPFLTRTWPAWPPWRVCHSTRCAVTRDSLLSSGFWKPLEFYWRGLYFCLIATVLDTATWPRDPWVWDASGRELGRTGN